MTCAAAIAFALAGCGTSSPSRPAARREPTAAAGSTAASGPSAERLRREDLIAVSRALTEPERSVAREVVASREAWPSVANGLPGNVSALPRTSIEAAGASAAQVPLPATLDEAQAAALTGPASGLAGLFRAYRGLTTRGWQLIDAAIGQIEHGSPASASFARANVALYIESIYDGHFDLAQIARKLPVAYRALGGAAAFGAALTQAEVDALAATYSEASDRLHPHPGVRLGS
jgi:hypothetical protein